MMGFNRILNGRKNKPQNLDLRKQAHIRNVPDIQIERAGNSNSNSNSSSSSSICGNSTTSPADSPPKDEQTTSSTSSLSLPAQPLTPMTPTSPSTHDFHILASLQISIKSNPAINQNIYAVPPNSPMLGVDDSNHFGHRHNTVGDLLHPSENNPIDVRKQGRLCLTFALRNDTDIPSSERIRLANELEDCIDGAYVGTDYRARIYTVGGTLSEQPGIVKMLIKGELTVEEVAVAKTAFHPITPVRERFEDKKSRSAVVVGFGNEGRSRTSPVSPTVVWSQELPDTPKFKPE